MNYGLKKQMEDSNLEKYNKFSLEEFMNFLKDISYKSDKTFTVAQEDLPELDEYNLKMYRKILRNIKKGYLYTFMNKRLITNGKRQIDVTAGYIGAKELIKRYREQNIPANIVYKMIRVNDYENNISIPLTEVKWKKL